MSEAAAEMDRTAKGDDETDAPLLRSGVNFLQEFAVFSGWTGVLGALLVCGGALLENVGILLLIPFLSLSMDNAAGGTWVEAHVGPVLALRDMIAPLQQATPMTLEPASYAVAGAVQ